MRIEAETPIIQNIAHIPVSTKNLHSRSRKLLPYSKSAT